MLGFLYEYVGYMRAPGSLEWDKPREWPNSWAATMKRLMPMEDTDTLLKDYQDILINLQFLSMYSVYHVKPYTDGIISN